MDDERWLTPEMITLSKKEPALPTSSGAEEAALRQLLLDFVEILDSLDRMCTGNHSNRVVESEWNRQLDALRTQIIQALEQAGITFEDSLGHSFDPTRHEAVGRVERDGIANYTITEVVERGYKWRGKVLRAARVMVSCRPETEILDQERNKS
jgi:molecular chaperone GrpE